MNGLSILTLVVSSTYFDPSVALQVKNLDSEVFRTRERAEGTLRKAGARAIPLLQRNKGSAESRRRADRIILIWHHQRVQRIVNELLQPGTPWLDVYDFHRFPNMNVGWWQEPPVIPLDTLTNRAAIAEHFFTCATGENSRPDWLKWRNATRLYVTAMIDRDVDPEEVRNLLEFIRPLEYEWVRAYVNKDDN